VLRWSSLGREEKITHLYELTKNFNETHPGINLRFEKIPKTSYNSKILTKREKIFYYDGQYFQ